MPITLPPIDTHTLIPRGIRNNNPGNIRLTSDVWTGMRSRQDDDDFVQFTDLSHGVRAMAITLLNYQDKHDLHTLRDIIHRWAPSAENDTDAYVQSVCRYTGWIPDTRLDLHQFTKLFLLIDAMIRVECGRPIGKEDITSGIKLAGVLPQTIDT